MISKGIQIFQNIRFSNKYELNGTNSKSALKTYSETKDYKRKIEMSKYAFTTYQKTLLDLRTVLRGSSFNKDDFIKEMNILDDTIVDFSPLVTKFEKQYAKQFTSGE